MKKALIKDYDVNLETVLFAHTSSVDYEMSRVVILHPSYGCYVVFEGGHCSCDDEFFGHSKIEGTEYTYEEIKKLAQTTWKDTEEGKFIRGYFNL